VADYVKTKSADGKLSHLIKHSLFPWLKLSVMSKRHYRVLFMCCVICFSIAIDLVVACALHQIMSVFIVSECEMHFCKYYIDGNIGEGN